MNKFIKVLCVILAVLMLVGMATACKKGGEEDEFDILEGSGTVDDNGDESGDENGDENTGDEITVTYVINISSKRFHKPTCAGAVSMKESNRHESTATRDGLREQN